ncbi:NAD(P)/FAD-dependent oxidoreductase [Acidaminobacter sp. JC074]|uniref:NAD(P)/FAD-dependent oxidoreductase n=1 Tax=Acidaminobacter sp. JC074 TaxID=2530199 RepID=UPI001F0D2861|nr:NAD(P)/FAD-dependent oxidoreductase [Acidaminobacter sp. JC074]
MRQWKLLQPIEIGSKKLRNRIVMPPMETRLSEADGSAGELIAAHYRMRAKGGVGMIIVENHFVDDLASRSAYMQGGMSKGHHIAGKYLISEAIKSEGAVAIIQLGHGGRQCAPGAAPVTPVSASDVAYGGITPTPLSIEEIVAIEDAFAAAAVRAELAGFDGVEIHGAHGYLITQFLSPLTNKRDDIYGGDYERRSTFAKNIIRKIREQVSKDFIVGIRLSGAEYEDGGLTIDDTTRFAKSVEEDIDYFHVSAGNYNTMAVHMITPLYVERAPIVDLAKKMKAVVNKPVITVGAINPGLAEQIIASEEADMVSFGRQLIADPDLPKKIMENRLEDIRPCVRGHEGCISLFFKGCPIRCEVNPQVGRDEAYCIKKTSTPQNVLVIGGGVAGMEAARVADEMGHNVTLLEKTNHLGGRFLEATEPSFKKEGRALVEWGKTQLEKSRVSIKMNTMADEALIREINPDAMIIATGSDYIQLPIKGIERALSPDNVLFDHNIAKDNVAIIGGGLIGSETALHLAEKGKKVSVFEMRNGIALEDEPLSRAALEMRLNQAGVVIHTNTKVVEVSDKGLIFNKDGKTETCNAETVVYATGLGPVPSEHFNGLCSKVFTIGDAVKGRKIFECFHEAWHAVLSI